jgi:uncharacterized protein with GYD domain
MLFIYIHTHPVEKCLLDKVEERNALFAQVRQQVKESGVKVIGMYSAPNEHTFFMVIEADDIAAIHQAVSPLTPWGVARLIPVTAPTIV